MATTATTRASAVSVPARISMGSVASQIESIRIIATGLEERSRKQLHGFLRLHSNPFMVEVRVEAVGQRGIGNRGTGLSTLLNNLGLEGFGVGTALWLHEKTRLKG